MNSLKNVCVVLVQPKNAGNVGGVARAMLNMGCHDLRLVLPQCDPLSQDSLDRAREAKVLLRQSRLNLTLSDAVSDCHLVWGSSRKHRHAKPNLLTPHEAATQYLNESSSKLALVFGPEDRGLNNDEIQKCDAVIHIPSFDEFPSLNLSHAVIVILYELFAAIVPTDTLEKRLLAPAKQKEDFYTHLKESLECLGFLDPLNPERIMRDLRNIFSRAQLDERELTILRGICRQILNRCNPK